MPPWDTYSLGLNEYVTLLGIINKEAQELARAQLELEARKRGVQLDQAEAMWRQELARRKRAAQMEQDIMRRQGKMQQRQISSIIPNALIGGILGGLGEYFTGMQREKYMSQLLKLYGG